MKKILVTGATGFVGTTLVEKLLEAGNEIIPIGRNIKSWNTSFIRDNLLELDFTIDNLPDLDEIDCACLLASVQPYSSNEWDRYYEVNSKQILHFLDNNIKRIIYISTTSINQVNGIPQPKNFYGLSKILAENLLRISKNNFDQVSIIRFPSVIGFNHQAGIAYDMRTWAENHKDIELFDFGKTYRNLIHVDDAVNAIMRIIKISAKKLDRFEIFDVGSSNSMTMYKLAQLIITLTNSNSKIIKSKKASVGEDVFVDNSKAMTLLGFVPKSVEESIAKYLIECGYEI